MKQHPLAAPSEESRLDILTGGTVDSVMNETLVLLRQNLKLMPDGSRRWC